MFPVPWLWLQDALGPIVRSLTTQARQMQPVDFAMLFVALGTFMVGGPGQDLF